jgi:RNA-binding protein
MPLTGSEKKYLRGLAHPLKPVVFIGQKGIILSVIKALDEAFDQHELIKVKFQEFKEKVEKQNIIHEIEEKTGALLCGLIGHTAIFFRQNPDPEQQKIHLPG